MLHILGGMLKHQQTCLWLIQLKVDFSDEDPKNDKQRTPNFYLNLALGTFKIY